MTILMAVSYTACSSDDDDDVIENVYSNVYGTYTGTLTVTPASSSGYVPQTMNATLVLTQTSGGTFSYELSGFDYAFGVYHFSNSLVENLSELNTSGIFYEYRLKNGDGSLFLQILASSNFTTISLLRNQTVTLPDDSSVDVTLSFTGTR